MTTFDKDPLYGPLPELTGEEKDIYTIDALDQWRADEHRRLDVLRAIGGFSDKYVDTYIESIDATLDRRLKTAGLSLDSQGYSEVWNLYRDATLDRVSDDEWGNSPKSRGVDDTDTKPYREKVGDRINQRMDSIDIEAATANYLEQKDTIDTEIADSSKKAAILYTKRMKVGVFGKRKYQYEEDFTDQQKSLDALLKQRSEIEIEQLQREGLSDEEIADRITEFENEQSHSLSNAQHDAMLGKFEQNDTRIARVRAFGRKALKAYGDLSTGKKIAAGIAIGGATIATGTAVAATGGAVFAASTALLGSARVGRAYFMSRSKLYEESKETHTVRAVNEDGSYKSPQEIIQESGELRQRANSERIKEGDKKKKIALALTAFSAAGMGYGLLHVAYDHIDSFRHGIHGIFGHSSPQHTQPLPGPKQPADVPPQNAPEQLPPPPLVDQDGTDSFEGISDSANSIQNGEGWYQTFSELGVTNAQDQARLLNNDVLMGKLSNMGLAYPNSNAGGWGIRMTANGKMPTKALKLIRDTAAQSQFVR